MKNQWWNMRFAIHSSESYFNSDVKFSEVHLQLYHTMLISLDHRHPLKTVSYWSAWWYRWVRDSHSFLLLRRSSSPRPRPRESFPTTIRLRWEISTLRVSRETLHSRWETVSGLAERTLDMMDRPTWETLQKVKCRSWGWGSEVRDIPDASLGFHPG